MSFQTITPIFLICIYSLHWFMVHKAKLTHPLFQLLNFKLIWNSLLLSSILISAITGAAMYFNIANLFILTLHTTAGIYTVLLVLFHILEHLYFFKNALIRLFKTQTIPPDHNSK